MTKTSKSKTLAGLGMRTLDEYVDSLPAHDNKPVVDDTFNDDLEITAFGDLNMVDELVIKESSVVGYGKSKIQVALCSDGATYFKRSDLASFLNLSRPGVINSYKRNIGAKESVTLMAKSSDGLFYPTVFISESQLTRYLEKRYCFYSRKMLRWLRKSNFFELENPISDTPAQTFGHIQWDMGTQDKSEAILATVCSKCGSTVPADSVSKPALSRWAARFLKAVKGIEVSE